MADGAPAAVSNSATVQALLLQDAQQEISTLRIDLYNTRRVAEERRQAVQTLTAQRDQLNGQVSQLENSLREAQSQLSQLSSLNSELHSAKEQLANLEKELQLSIAARRILEKELSDERQQKQAAEEAKAVLEVERARQQKARDDLAAQLRLAQKRAVEAEEEQLRAEEEVAQLRGELAALHSTGMHDTMQGVHAAEPSASAGDLRILTEQVEYERNRAATLLNNLHAAKAEVASMQAQIQRLQAHEQEAERLRQETDSLRSEVEYTAAKTQFLESQLAQAQAQAAQPQGPAHPHSASSHRGSEAGAAAVQKQDSSRQLQHQPSQQDIAVYDQASPTGSSPDVQRLQAQVAKLKASRDKLLEQIDKQWEELDRLSTDNKVLQDELDCAQRLATNWEAQAQDGLAHVERLKEMLEESAGWAAAGSAAAAAAAGGSEAAAGAAPRAPSQLASELLKEKARGAELELQLRALAAELLRAQHSSMAMGRSVLPVLSGIEHRLGEITAEGRRQQRQAAALAAAALTAAAVPQLGVGVGGHMGMVHAGHGALVQGAR